MFASVEGEIDTALAGLGARSQALIIHPDILFTQHREKLAALAIREKLPALYSTRNFPQAGGLMGYGTSFLDAHRLVGIYAGRILKGEKPGDLPVQADQIRAGHQSQDRQSARPRRTGQRCSHAPTR